ncbi:SCAN domain-containing protein 3-like [Oratosquilla oratoria]|uniref:SCAN domain-containing protein 3-like n=1 Tax=Oratosquilla oratoria TaxID=337810 RepID=UPI003F7663B5
MTYEDCHNSSMMSKKRLYKEEFLGTGFTYLIDNGNEKPQCAVCVEVLSQELFKENKLKRHFQGKHPTLAGKTYEHFKRKEQQLERQWLENPMHSIVCSLQQPTIVSYLVAKRITKCTIGEKLVKPAALDMIRTIIRDIAVVAAIKESGNFRSQLDESTNVSDNAQLLVYVRYQGKSDINEDFLFCKRMETTTTGEDLFKLVDSFIKEEGLRWDQCFSVCADGAPAMLGARQGFTARVKHVNPTVIVTHCLLHRENLASRKMLIKLNTVMKDVIQIVNFIKSSALNSRLFSQMCSDMKIDYEHLLYYSPVRWLSLGKVLQRMLDMRVEVEIFLNKKKHALASKLSEPGKTQGFQGKDEVVEGKDRTGENVSFPLLNVFLEHEEDASLLDVQNVIVGHLEKLSEEFDRGHFVEVQHDETLHFNFQRQPLGVFCTAVKKEKPMLGCEAVKVLLHFATTYLCESGFAALTVIKTKYRNWLRLEHDLIVALSKTEPRIEKLSSMMQTQGSH